MSRRPLPPRCFAHAAPWALAAAAALHAGGCTAARAGDTPPTPSPPAPPAAAMDTPTADAADVPIDAPAEQLLDRLEAAAADHRTLTARVRMRSIQDLLDDETMRFGDLAWARADDTAGTPTRFNVAFDRLKTLDGPLEAVDRRYVYDGQWLLDLDGQARTATRRELHEAQADNADDPDLEFGDGPFLVPLNLRKARVLSRFAASLAEPDADADPEGDATDHLVLIPRPATQIDAVRLDLWFDRATRLPRRAASTQADGDRTVVDLFEVQLNPTLPNGGFDTALPGEPGWELQTVPLQPAPDGENP